MSINNHYVVLENHMLVSLTQVSARFHIVSSDQYHQLTNMPENFQTKQQMQNFWQQNISILNLIISIFFFKNLTLQSTRKSQQPAQVSTKKLHIGEVNSAIE